MFFIGIDPDLHNTGLALLNGDTGEVIEVKCVSSSGKKEEEAVIAMARALRFEWFPGYTYLDTPSTVVIEAQEIYAGGGTKNPRNIMHLAQVAGAAIAIAIRITTGPKKNLWFPRPAEWKGQVPKRIHQARILKRMKWDCQKVGTKDRGYCYPTMPNSDLAREPLQKTQWKHVVDAIGLAQWGIKRHQYGELQSRMMTSPLISRSGLS